MKLKKLLPLAAVAGVVGTAVPMASCSCTLHFQGLTGIKVEMDYTTIGGERMINGPITVKKGEQYLINIDLSKWLSGSIDAGGWAFGIYDGTENYYDFENYSVWLDKNGSLTKFTEVFDSIEIAPMKYMHVKISNMVGLVGAIEEKTKPTIKIQLTIKENKENVYFRFGSWGG